MNMFVALFEEEISPEILEDAKSISGRCIPVSERVLLIRNQGDNPSTISDVLNLDGETQASNVGVVFRLDDSHSGYYYRDLWNWVKEARRMAVGRI